MSEQERTTLEHPKKVQFLLSGTIDYEHKPRWVQVPWRLERAATRINKIRDLIPAAVEAWDGEHPWVRAPLSEPTAHEVGGNVSTSWAYHDGHLAEMTLLASEAIHHLRSSLDYVAFQMVLSDAGSVESRTQFPIAKDPASFRKDVKSRLRGVHPERVALVEAVQPFNGPSWARDLNTLSNRDKHRWPVDVSADYTFTVYPDDLYLDPLGEETHRGFQIEDARISFRFVDAIGADNTDLEVVPTLEKILIGAVNLVADLLEAYKVTEVEIDRLPPRTEPETQD